MGFVQIAQANDFHVGQLGEPVQVVCAHAIQANVSHAQPVTGGNFAFQTGKHSQTKRSRTALLYKIPAIGLERHSEGAVQVATLEYVY